MRPLLCSLYEKPVHIGLSIYHWRSSHPHHCHYYFNNFYHQHHYPHFPHRSTIPEEVHVQYGGGREAAEQVEEDGDEYPRDARTLGRVEVPVEFGKVRDWVVSPQVSIPLSKENSEPSQISNKVLTFEVRGPGFKYQLKGFNPLFFVLGPPDVIPLSRYVGQGHSSGVEQWPSKPEAWVQTPAQRHSAYSFLRNSRSSFIY